MTLTRETCEKFVGKGENADSEHFLRIQRLFYLSSANVSNFDESKFLSFGKELNNFIPTPFEVLFPDCKCYLSLSVTF